MPETTFTFRVDHDLKSAFADAASAQERTAAQLLRVLMRETVEQRRTAEEHDAWFRGEVERAVAEAESSDTARIPHDEVRSTWHQQRAELERRTAGRTA